MSLLGSLFANPATSAERKAAEKARKAAEKKAKEEKKNTLEKFKREVMARARDEGISNSAVKGITLDKNIGEIIAAAKKRNNSKKAKHGKNAFEKDIFARANAIGIPRGYIKIVKGKSIDELLAAAKKRRNASATKKNKTSKLNQLKAAARARGLSASNLKLRGSLSKAIERLSAKAKKVKKDRNVATSKREIEAAVRAAGINGFTTNDFKYVRGKNVGQHIEYTRKRIAARSKKQTQGEKLRSLQRYAAEKGVAVPTKLVGSLSKAKGVLNKRIAKTKKNTERLSNKNAMKQAVKNAGINEKYFKYTGKKTAADYIRYAKARSNASATKRSRVTNLQNILGAVQILGIGEKEIKSAFCGRAK